MLSFAAIGYLVLFHFAVILLLLLLLLLFLLLLPFYKPLDFVWNYPGELAPER